MKHRYSLSMVREYLFDKVSRSVETDEEYGLYLELLRNEEFNTPYNRKLVSKIIKSMDKEEV